MKEPQARGEIESRSLSRDGHFADASRYRRAGAGAGAGAIEVGRNGPVSGYRRPPQGWQTQCVHAALGQQFRVGESLNHQLHRKLLHRDKWALQPERKTDAAGVMAVRTI